MMTFFYLLHREMFGNSSAHKEGQHDEEINLMGEQP